MNWAEASRELTKPQPIFPFIAGSARSGTTLLQAMFNSHPRMAVTFKSYFVQDLAAHQSGYREAIAVDLLADLGYETLLSGE